tara:strand:- start:973 stop:1584 length:612 start_codon:yes stop_codon:yes gene_type:complete
MNDIQIVQDLDKYLRLGLEHVEPSQTAALFQSFWEICELIKMDWADLFQILKNCLDGVYLAPLYSKTRRATSAVEMEMWDGLLQKILVSIMQHWEPEHAKELIGVVKKYPFKPSISLYLTFASVEDAAVSESRREHAEKMRALYREMQMIHGENCDEAWLAHMDWEKEHGYPSKASEVYRKAIRTLKSSERFVEQCTLQKMEE